MGIFLPPKHVRSPELLIPGRKPVGPVEIDWTHPLSKSLVFCCVLTPTGTFDLVSGKQLSYSGTHTPGSRGGEMMWVFDGASDNFQLDQPPNMADMGGSMTVLWRGALDTVTSKVHVFAGCHATTNGSSNNYFDFRTDSSGNAVCVRADSAGYAINDGPQLTANALLTVTYKVTGGTSTAGTFCVNGKSTAASISTDTSSNGTPSTTEPIWIGQRRDSGSICLQGGMSMVAGWSRELTDTENESVTLNPFQFLKPAGT